MSKLTTALLVVLTILIGTPVTMNVIDKYKANEIVQTTTEGAYVDKEVPAPTQLLQNKQSINPINNIKVMTLEESNVYVFRGQVTEDSVSKAMQELQKKSRRLSKNTPIYIVLDTPGGSVFDGLDFIDFVNALPQKVHSITLFAASMGFQFAQNLDRRYIIRNGTLMSHRASLGGLGGQLDGEFETRYRMIKRKVDYLDLIAAKRMSMKVVDYKAMIVNEYWVHGFDAVAERAADEQILLRCGESLDGGVVQTFRTFFGPVDVTFSKCPLIKAPLKVDFSKILDIKSRNYLKYTFNLMLNDQQRYVREFIATDKYQKIFPQ